MTPPGSRSWSPELNSQARSSVSDEVRIKELELERARVELEREKLVAVNRKESRNADRHFDVAKHVRMVPPFEEEGVEKYFPHFEKLAQSMGWPREMWAHLIQSKFSGKARDAYLAMSMADVSDYDKVKSSVLKAYELVPEAYRQRFRKARKEESQTHMEFSKQKEQLFDRWSSSLHVDHDYDKLREILLLEEFKRSVRLDVRIHLEEQRVDSLDEAARIADDYVLTHKISNKVSVEPKKNGNWSKSQKTSSSQVKDEIKPQSQQGQVTEERMCYACKQYGHIKSKCPSLQAKKQESSAHPNAFVQTVSSSRSRIVPVNMEKIRKEYEPFVSVGYVSIPESDVARKVKVLRDTGASQSLILESALPFCGSSSVGASVLLKGIGDGFVEAPLHVVDLKSDLVSGMVKMAVRPSLPVEGVSIILGNDLAGDRVVSCPVVSSSPCESSETDELVAEFPVVFPACAVTRSMAKKVESEKKSNEIDVDLGDSFFCRLVEDESDSNVDESARKDHSVGNSEKSEPLSLNKSELLKEQQTDPQLSSLNERAVSEEEALTVPVCYYKKAGVLMRKWRPADVPADEVWKEVHQIVVPSTYRQDIISLAHEAPLAGHLGVHKTQEKILSHFFWPGVQKDVANFCRSCHACQVVGKPNQKIPAAPLKPIPAFDEPFSRIIVDCVGPLPKTKAGNEYLLTIMCAATTYIRRDDENKAQPVLSAVECDSKCAVEKEVCKIERENPCVKLKNSEVLAHIDNKLTHLSVKERSDERELLSEYPQLFADVPSRTDAVEHDVDVGDPTPIKQAPYRANPTKLKNLEKEIECESAFNQAKVLLSTNPVLMATDFNQPFSMMVDVSDVGAGAVLTQADAEGIDRPISFFSKKLWKKKH